MKIIDFKPDNTAYAKRLNGCEKFYTREGIDFYYTADDESKKYFCHIVGTVDLLENLDINPFTTPEQVKGMIERQPTERLKQLATVEGKLERIRQAIAAKSWTSNADAFFCEMVGQSELADEVRKNRAAIYEQRAREEQEHREKDEAEQRAREEAEQRKRLEEIEQAERNLRAGEFITPQGFELLAEKYGVKLPIKFVGWLREHCGKIKIEQYSDEDKQKYILIGKYNTLYYHSKGHKSTAIYDYADKLAEAVGI